MSIFASVFQSLTSLLTQTDLYPLALFSAVLGVLITGFISLLKGM